MRVTTFGNQPNQKPPLKLGHGSVAKAYERALDKALENPNSCLSQAVPGIAQFIKNRFYPLFQRNQLVQKLTLGVLGVAHVIGRLLGFDMVIRK